MLRFLLSRYRRWRFNRRGSFNTCVLRDIIDRQRERLQLAEIQHGADVNTINTLRDENRRLRLNNDVHGTIDWPRQYGPYLVFLGGGKHWHEAHYTSTGWRVMGGHRTAPILCWRRMPPAPELREQSRPVGIGEMVVGGVI